MASGATKSLLQAQGRINTRNQGRSNVYGSSEDLIGLDVGNSTNASVTSNTDETPTFGEVQEKRGRQLSQKARENEAAIAAQDAESKIRRRRTSASTGPVSTKEFNMLYNLVSKVFEELVNVRKEIDTVCSELKAVSGEVKKAQSTTKHVRDKVNDLEGRFNDVIQQVGTVQKGVNSISTTTASYASKVSSGLALPSSAATTPSSAMTGLRSVATGASTGTLAQRKLLHLSLKNVEQAGESAVKLSD